MLNLPHTHWSDTELYGLLGSPVRKSLSAKMHNANFAAMGMNAAYYPLDVEEKQLDRVMAALSLFKYKGVNVTMPLKKAVIPYLDELDEMGELCGAVNTIAVRDGRLVGTNTDGTGFVRSLREQASFDPAGKSCVLLGSGGAGRGISFALARAGVGRIVLMDIKESESMLGQLVSDLNAYTSGVAEGVILTGETMRSRMADAELVINATCVGMAPNEQACAIAPDLLQKQHMICDIVYVPSKTRLLQEAGERGCATLEGYWMLLWQGVEAFRFWTGQDPDVATMRDVVLRSIGV